MLKEKKKICCICKCEYTGWGNNPKPVKSKGRCCDMCNNGIVITQRLYEWKLEMNSKDRVRVVY